MDSALAVELFRQYKHCYHGIFGSPVRTDYLEGHKDYNILYKFHCADKQGDHPHAHYLFFSDIKPDAIKKRMQRVEKAEVGNYNRIKHVKCEDWLMNCVHYFHCPRGQSGHVHDFGDCGGSINPDYLHPTTQCKQIHEVIRQTPIQHNGETCPCKESKKAWSARMVRSRRAKALRAGELQVEELKKLPFFKTNLDSVAITKDNIETARNLLKRRNTPKDIAALRKRIKVSDPFEEFNKFSDL